MESACLAVLKQRFKKIGCYLDRELIVAARAKYPRYIIRAAPRFTSALL